MGSNVFSFLLIVAGPGAFVECKDKKLLVNGNFLTNNYESDIRCRLSDIGGKAYLFGDNEYLGITVYLYEGYYYTDSRAIIINRNNIRRIAIAIIYPPKDRRML